jgi:dienelactone hydrolase
MSPIVSRDIDYVFGDTRMQGLLLAPEGAESSPTVVLIHDAFGLAGFSLDAAHRYADLGYVVFAADVWGDRFQPTDESAIGPVIESMVSDRAEWHARIAAAHEAAIAQPEVDPTRIVMAGYCFGGSSALEYARTGADLSGVVAIHPGLDLLDPDGEWALDTSLRALVCVGADDPMATPEQRAALTTAMTGAGVDWELDLYGGTVHGFTNPILVHSPAPHVIAYHPGSAARAWASTVRLLAETLLHPASEPQSSGAQH